MLRKLTLTDASEPVKRLMKIGAIEEVADPVFDVLSEIGKRLYKQDSYI